MKTENLKCYWKSKNGAGNSAQISNKLEFKKKVLKAFSNKENLIGKIGNSIVARVWKEENNWNYYIDENFMEE